MHAKKWLCALLVLVMVLSILPYQNAAAAEYVGFKIVGEAESELILRDADVVAAGGPSLAAGNHARWIDRIADLPDYAADFYTWLEDNATAAGALADPSLGDLASGRYVYILDTVSGTAEFTYTSGSDLQTLASNAVAEATQALAQTMMEYAFAVYGAFDRDHPEVFWLDGSSQCGYGYSYRYGNSGSNGYANYNMTVYFYLQTSSFDVRAAEYRDTAAVAAAIAQRDSDVDRILADCPVDSTAADQIKYLNKVLTETNAYNSCVASGNSAAAADDAWECVSALSGSCGAEGPVCEGYARAFKVLCDKLGIPCVLVEGNAKATVSDAAESHMWNYVQLGSSWYAVDVTWDDPLISGKYEQIVTGHENEEWLLLGGNTQVAAGLSFLDSHIVQNAITADGINFTNGPVLAADAYVQPDNYMDVSSYRSGDGYTAPSKEGKLFAGWYTDEELTQPLGTDVTAGYAYAKFVDENVLSIKYQITANTTADSSSTDLRFLTGVDSLDYQTLDFNVTVNGATRVLSVNKVYEQILTNGQIIASPSLVFGEEARYFATYTLWGVPQNSFETDITVTASWLTMDGTVVCGAERTFHISQAF